MNPNGATFALMKSEPVDPRLQTILKSVWGYEHFRPLQAEAMQCVMQSRDSVVIMPTGGGKSLCFQVPALCKDELAIVVSPLISLMKDQVDTLQGCGVRAACLHHMVTYQERRRIHEDLVSGRLQLLYVAPERLVHEKMIQLLQTVPLSLIAIDEAHCISAWGHDFRPEYRELGRLKQAFPGVSVHAYTATATAQVRRDIVEQLSLDDPSILVGSFDRPNLIYQVKRRENRLAQIREVIDRHPGESGIVYCISRADVDATCASLTQLGYRVRPYHAGMEDDQRRRNQDEFIHEEIDLIVATVAFGMGIDKPNVRYVVHAGMPKSLEHYQQESGRAGRDGLAAHCVLLYSGSDFMTWSRMLEDLPEEPRQGATQSLSGMYQFCTSVQCRHQSIVQHFGQSLPDQPCGACDVCLGELDLVDDPVTIGQKILSCVVRLQQRFGGDYTAKVLHGSQEERIVRQQHHQLSTWGLLSNEKKGTIRDWIEQLVQQQYLEKSGEYQILQVTSKGRQLLRGEETPRLLRPAKRAKVSRPRGNVEEQSWQGVDRGLLDALRRQRHQIAQQRSVPAYIVFNDLSLREMACIRPSNLAGFHQIKGVGEKKLADYGETFVRCIVEYCQANQVAMDVELPSP